jgi:16S rRNA processing protein RimM
VSEPEQQPRYVSIARLIRSRGNRGELVCEDLSDDPARFTEGKRVFVRDSRDQRSEYSIEKVWYHKGRLILKFGGIDTISDAEGLRGFDVQLSEDEIGPAARDAHFYTDLIGCKVVDAETDRRIGQVEDILEPGGALLLQVEADGREVLIPFVSEICVEIETEQKMIRVRLPEGLEELNR